MFDWDKANIAHIAEHEVLPHEAEEADGNDPLYLDYSLEDGEERHRKIGETLYRSNSDNRQHNAR